MNREGDVVPPTGAVVKGRETRGQCSGVREDHKSPEKEEVTLSLRGVPGRFWGWETSTPRV